MFKDLMAAAREDVNRMRVMVAFEEDYRVYQDAIVHTIRALRPHIEVSDAELDALEVEVVHLCPHLAISSRLKNVVAAADVPAWLKLPTGRDRSAEFWLDGQCSEMDDPGLDEILRVLDETERLVRTKANSGAASQSLSY